MRRAAIRLALRCADHLLLILAGLLHVPVLPIGLDRLTLDDLRLAARSSP